jgi:hypothetical protein
LLVTDATFTQGEAAVQVRVWKKSARAAWALRGPLGDPPIGDRAFDVLDGAAISKEEKEIVRSGFQG